METSSTTILPHLLVALSLLTGANSAFIKVPRMLHGVCGRPLFLPVEYKFSTEGVDIQGDWQLQTASGRVTTLVTFRNHLVIAHMGLEHRLFFTPPNASLLIDTLDEAAQGVYKVEIRLKFPNETRPVTESEEVRVTANVPVSIPIVHKNPGTPVVEDKDNVTLRCSVESGSNVRYRWIWNNVPLAALSRYRLSQDNGTLVISPVRKEDIGDYVCEASNYVSKKWSRPVALTVFYGPYNLEVSSEHGLRTGEVFTINPGQLVFFECWVDSNPPGSCVWISKNTNSSRVVTTGPRLEVMSDRLAHTEEYVCRAFNNVTQKQDETQFTLVVASLGTEKHFQIGDSVSPLAAVMVSSLVIIACMVLALFRRSCHPHRVMMDMYNRNHKPLSEQKRTHLSGHEDATEDFGIYEFVSIPGRADSTRASSRSLAGLNSVQDSHTTIYDVIRHVPEAQEQSLLK